MPARITAVARTPWAQRHTALAGVRPEALLAAALRGASERADRGAERIDRLLVACGETVGAQHGNIARRVALDLGWDDVAALTVDGAGPTGLALVDLAATLPGRTVVATVDCTTTVPPGAGLVRDYGRPELGEPEVAVLERLAAQAGLERADLDRVISRTREPMVRRAGAIATVTVGGRAVDTDHIDRRELDSTLPPLVEGGLQTADHTAEYADGAAAIVIEAEGVAGRSIADHGVATGSPADAVDRLAELGAAARDRGAAVAVATPHAVVAALCERAGGRWYQAAVDAVAAVGSTPSGDGLRMLVDAWHAEPARCCIIGSAGDGQLPWIELAPMP